jgi:two-component system sensor histidine kinase ChvG
MASDTVIRRPEPPGDERQRRQRKAPPARRGRPLAFSALTRLIFLANLGGVLVLILGSLVLNEMRQGLIVARIASLQAEGELIASVLAQVATEGEPETRLDLDEARNQLRAYDLPDFARVRLYSYRDDSLPDGTLIGDSWRLNDRVLVRELEPVDRVDLHLDEALETAMARLRSGASEAFTARTEEEEVANAIAFGEPVSGQRINELGERVVSVSVPVQRVRRILGVLMLESSDVDTIVAAERRALLPFIGAALVITLITSILLTLFIARPLQRLARAADRVRRAGPRRVAIPDLSRRHDDIGDLSRALREMTEALYARIDAIESFAADVGHEIKNPLTSIRSAAETLLSVKDEASRERLLAVLTHDVRRLDRLISDISRASRLDAELARESGGPVDLRHMLADIAELYKTVRRDGEPDMRFENVQGEPVIVWATESLLSNVFRNLLDNARTFSPPGGCVRIFLRRTWLDGEPAAEVAVEDEGPGIPPENLQAVFERFYTERPKGSAFGSHSGLGLSIARQIVQAHRGTICAENRLDESGARIGARFIVVLRQNP